MEYQLILFSKFIFTLCSRMQWITVRPTLLIHVNGSYPQEVQAKPANNISSAVCELNLLQRNDDTSGPSSSSIAVGTGVRGFRSIPMPASSLPSEGLYTFNSHSVAKLQMNLNPRYISKVGQIEFIHVVYLVVKPHTDTKYSRVGEGDKNACLSTLNGLCNMFILIEINCWFVGFFYFISYRIRFSREI